MKPWIMFLLLLFSCSGEERKLKVSAVRLSVPVDGDELVETSTVSAMMAPPDRAGDLILKSATLKFQVDNVDESIGNIEKLVAQKQAVITGQNLTNSTTEISNDIQIRVPSSGFEVLVEDLCKEALFINQRRIYTENVTEEYEDIQTRLKTKREVRDRYTEILKTKAKSVEDILKAEEHIRVLQEEIEAKEGRIRFLQSRVSMSEIKLEIYQKVAYKEVPTLTEKPYIAKAKQAIADGWGIIESFSLLLINTWPLVVFGSIITLWIRSRILKRRREEDQAEASVA
ncbi:hypothetical protein WSM22_42160 [Cytophagales bacterium WSM2-2]|nr:hypothetical protein WSM22_42160 [Cytophagales bacterium WSM2-2]